ncbi:methyl-accepting chemotaxis protein [bacterium]|nr:methyl-accepting chemotaxis protein [bacterium]
MRMSVGRKLGIGFGACVFILVAMTSSTLVRLSTIGKLQQESAERAAEASVALEASSTADKMYRVIADAQINQEMDDTEANWELIRKEALQDQAEIEKLAYSDEEKVLVANAGGELEVIIDLFEHDMLPQIKDALANGQVPDTKDMDGDIDGYVSLYREPLIEFSDSLQARSHLAQSACNLQMSRVRRESIILALLGILASVLGALLVTRSVVRPVRQMREVAESIARGDLQREVRLSGTDEVGQLGDSFRQMIASLRQKTEVARRISEGDLAVEITAASAADELAAAMLAMIQRLRSMNEDVAALTAAAREGRLDSRADSSRHGGDFGRLIEGVNHLLDTVTEPINEAAQVLRKAAAKDLSHRVRGDYRGRLAEFKQDINTTLESLGAALTRVSEAVEQVSSASGQIASGSQSLAAGANEQASSLEEVSASLEQISSMTRQNADNADQARRMAAGAREAVDKGRVSMQRMTESITRIKASSDKTAKIVKTIDEIAFQTNLLALNAAVEAARAGEAGKGFAVVAEEVRSLAQRSAQAAKDTAVMIEEGVKNAEGGVGITAEVDKALTAITEAAGKVDDLVAEIASAVKEQAQGIEQVNTAMSDMDKVTQSNASNSEQSASAAEELSSQAGELRGMVAEFKLGAAAQTEAVPRAATARTALPAAAPVARSGRARAGEASGKQAGDAPAAKGKTAQRPERPLPSRIRKITPLNEDDLKEL